jgi:hypothetical protein
VTTAHAPAAVADQTARARRTPGWLGFALPPATLIALVGLALVLLVTPVWVNSAIDLAGGSVSGGNAIDAHSASDATVRDLLFGGDFAVIGPDGNALFTRDEAAHMADVRIVLYAFLLLALVSATAVVAALTRAPRDPTRWRAVARGAAILAVAVIALGVTGALAFSFAFELFHRLLFPGGNWAFPEDSNLIRLYPMTFWQLSAAAIGVLALAGAAVVWMLARRRAAALERSA